MPNDYTYSSGETTLLKIDNVSLEIDGNPILKDITAEVKNIKRPNIEQGQVIGILGPSGIGKTKLFEVLSGLIHPTTGGVSIDDEKSNTLIPVHPGLVGVIQQSYPLFNNRTVMGNLEVAVGRNGYTANEKKDKINQMLERFKLHPFRHNYPAQLSGGQRQRVAIAQQMLCSLHYLLMDEPFSGLDVNMIHEVCELITEISQASDLNTIIVVSHDISSTAGIADLLWLMGRDRDETGNIIAGSKFKYIYDLIEMNLAWHKNLDTTPAFVELMKDIKEKFGLL